MKKIFLFCILFFGCRIQNIEGDRLAEPNLWYCYRTSNNNEVCARTRHLCEEVENRVEVNISLSCRPVER